MSDNPTGATDPSGLFPGSCGGGGGGGNGGGIGGDGQHDGAGSKLKEFSLEMAKESWEGMKRGGPEEEMSKMDKGIKREVVKEYRKLLEDADKTREEGVDPITKTLRDLWNKASKALCP